MFLLYELSYSDGLKTEMVGQSVWGMKLGLNFHSSTCDGAVLGKSLSIVNFISSFEKYKKVESIRMNSFEDFRL
jgi:hypothetical protein